VALSDYFFILFQYEQPGAHAEPRLAQKPSQIRRRRTRLMPYEMGSTDVVNASEHPQSDAERRIGASLRARIVPDERLIT
jgi:hypothetical protein